MSSLLDQTALSNLAERLVAAARRAGADAADAVAVRSMSLSVGVREGAVDGVGALRERRRRAARVRRPPHAVVSTNDIAGDVAPLAERAVAMAKVAPEDKFAGLADEARLARTQPELDLLDPDMPSVAVLEDRALRAEAAAPRGQGRQQVGRRVGVGRHRRHGAGDQPRLSRRLSRCRAAASACRRSRARAPRWKPTTTSPARCMPPISSRPRRSGAPPASARWRGSIRARSTPPRCRSIFDKRVCGLAGRASRRRDQRQLRSRARRASSRTSAASACSDPGIRIIDDPLRQRGQRSRPFDGEGVAGARLALIDDGVLTSWLLDSATARELGLDDHRPCPARRVVGAVAGRDQSASRSRHDAAPEQLIADIQRRLLRHQPDRHGRQPGDRRLQPRRVRLLDRERQATYPVSEVTIAGNLVDMFASLTPANDLEFRYAVNAPTVRVEGLTVAGR